MNPLRHQTRMGFALVETAAVKQPVAVSMRLPDMPAPIISRFDVLLAQICRHCPVCRRARQRQRGVAFGLVKTVERRLCPFCRAYERIHGRPAHAPDPRAVGN